MTERLFDQFTGPATPRVRWWAGDERMTETIPTEIVRDMGNRWRLDSVRVTADEIAEWFDRERPKAEFGPIRPPFPTMMIEYQWPGSMLIHGPLGKAYGSPEFGKQSLALIEETPVSQEADAARAADYDPPPEGATHCFRLRLLLSDWFNRGIMAVGPYLVFFLDAEGHVLQTRSALDRMPPDEEGEEMVADISNNVLTQGALPALFTLAMMNCRNVSLVEHPGASRMSRKSRRERLPRLSFHTIKLPHSINRTHASTGAATGRTTSFHLVRGHFKTYTAERPLLGRSTGTYWWGWQTRGSAEQGVVVSDYQVTKGTE